MPGVQSAAQESWWLHQPGYSDQAHRIATGAYGGGNLVDQSNPAVRDWFKTQIDAGYDQYDGLMMDDTTGSLSMLTYGTGYASSQEIAADNSLQQAHDQMAAAMTHTHGTPLLQIDNGLSANNNLATPFPLLNDTTSMHGVIAEGAPISNGTLTSYYSTLLDEMAYVDQTPQDFLVLLSYDPNASPQSRLIQTATTLLGYNQNHIISWADLETNNTNLSVWPEQGLVGENPIQTMSTPTGPIFLTGQGITCTTGGHNDLQIAPGIYRREFADCYNQQTPIGPCATIINTTTNPTPIQPAWLTQTYTHQLTLQGTDIQTGGTINPTGTTYTPNTTTLQPHTATILTT